jgi:hypothetical protein
VGAGELAGEAVAFDGGLGLAPGYLRQAGGLVLPLAIEGLIGGLERGVRRGNLLELLDPVGMSLSELSLFGDFSLERRRPTPMPTEFLFGLFEQLLVPFQHPALLPVRFEQLSEIQPQPRLGGAGLVQLGFEGAV